MANRTKRTSAEQERWIDAIVARLQNQHPTPTVYRVDDIFPSEFLSKSLPHIIVKYPNKTVWCYVFPDEPVFGIPLDALMLMLDVREKYGIQSEVVIKVRDRVYCLPLDYVVRGVYTILLGEDEEKWDSEKKHKVAEFMRKYDVDLDYLEEWVLDQTMVELNVYKLEEWEERGLIRGVILNSCETSAPCDSV